MFIAKKRTRKKEIIELIWVLIKWKALETGAFISLTNDKKNALYYIIFFCVQVCVFCVHIGRVSAKRYHLQIDGENKKNVKSEQEYLLLYQRSFAYLVWWKSSFSIFRAMCCSTITPNNIKFSLWWQYEWTKNATLAWWCSKFILTVQQANIVNGSLVTNYQWNAISLIFLFL